MMERLRTTMMAEPSGIKRSCSAKFRRGNFRLKQYNGERPCLSLPLSSHAISRCSWDGVTLEAQHLRDFLSLSFSSFALLFTFPLFNPPFAFARYSSPPTSKTASKTARASHFAATASPPACAPWRTTISALTFVLSTLNRVTAKPHILRPFPHNTVLGMISIFRK